MYYVYIYKSMIIHDTYFIPNYFESCPRLVSKLRGRFRRESGPWSQSKKVTGNNGDSAPSRKGNLLNNSGYNTNNSGYINDYMMGL